jgi:hypothetical protein
MHILLEQEDMFCLQAYNEVKNEHMFCLCVLKVTMHYTYIIANVNFISNVIYTEISHGAENIQKHELNTKVV